VTNCSRSSSTFHLTDGQDESNFHGTTRSQVVHLNRSEYFTDTPFELLGIDATVARYLYPPKEIFAPHLRELTLTCVQFRILEHYRVLALPSLESLELHCAPHNRPDDYRVLQAAYKSTLLARWNTMVKNKICNLSLVGFSAKYWVNGGALFALSNNTALNTLQLYDSQDDGSATHSCLAAFRSSFSTLKTLVVAARDLCVTGDWYDASVFGSSEVRLNTVLEHLVIDLDDLNETEMSDAVTDDIRETIIYEVTVEGNTYR
jgi:hypothetical protein